MALFADAIGGWKHLRCCFVPVFVFFLLHVFIVVRCRVSRENKVAQEKLLNPETCPLDRTGRRAVRQSTVRAVMSTDECLTYGSAFSLGVVSQYSSYRLLEMKSAFSHTAANRCPQGEGKIAFWKTTASKTENTKFYSTNAVRRREIGVFISLTMCNAERSFGCLIGW